MPIATSIKNVENPVTPISRSWRIGCAGRRSRSVFRRVKKCESITTNEIPAPTAVARPAPNIPMSSVNTQK